MKLLAFVVVLVSLVSKSAEGATLEDRIRRATEEYGAGDFDDAVRTLSGAIANYPTAAAPALARAYRILAAAQFALGKEVATRESVIRALRIEPAGTLDPKRFPPALIKLFDEVRRTLTGTLAVRCDRAGARVEIDGVHRGQCPMELEVALGKHRVVVIPHGEASQAHDVLVDSVGKKEVGFTFAVAPAPAREDFNAKAPRRKDAKSEASSLGDSASLRLSPLPAPASASAKPPEIRLPAPPPKEPVSRARRTVGWTLVGSGGVALVVGTILQIVVASDKGKQESANQKLEGSYTVGDLEAVERREKVSIALLVGGAVVTAAGVTLLLIRWKQAAATRVELGVVPLAAQGGSIAPGIGARVSF